MKHLLLCICFLAAMPMLVHAQFLQGTVTDEATGKKIKGVMVINQKTQAYAHTDKSGFYMLKAATGDTIVYLSATYVTLKKMAAERVADVKLTAETYSLDEVEILSDIKRYELEYDEMLSTYDKTFKDAGSKPSFSPHAGTMPGFTINGAVSGAARKVSGKRKRDKRFLRDFQQVQNDKYVALRYNPEAVMAATKTTRDSAVAFINDNPMDIELNKDASYIELSMWIRRHFDTWVNKPKQTKVQSRGAD